jgi:hypothetical protein
MNAKIAAIVAAFGLAAVGAGMLSTAAPAHATGCTQAPFAAWCDNPPVNARGDHWHCDTSPFHYACGWRTGDNQPIGNPGD